MTGSHTASVWHCVLRTSYGSMSSPSSLSGAHRAGRIKWSLEWVGLYQILVYLGVSARGQRVVGERSFSDDLSVTVLQRNSCLRLF